MGGHHFQNRVGRGSGFIEGIADRHRNIQIRLRDYKVKFDQLFDIYGRLELLYPEVEAFQILENSSHTKAQANAEARDLEKIIMVHSLDLLYFWMYQPDPASRCVSL